MTLITSHNEETSAEIVSAEKSDKAVVALFVGAMLVIVGITVFMLFQDGDVDSSPPSSVIDTIDLSVDGEAQRFFVPELDLRGYPLNHFEVEQWFLTRINYHRENYGLHPYEPYLPATVTSIEHSLDMRDNDFSANESSDGRRHQVRHDRWMGVERTRVTSTLVASRRFPEGPITQADVAAFADYLFERESRHSFIMNPIYYYLGVGFSVAADGRGRLCLTFASKPDEREAHHKRSPEEREIHRQEYLERIRAERGWIP